MIQDSQYYQQTYGGQPVRLFLPLFKESPPLVFFGQNTSLMPIVCTAPEFRPRLKVSPIYSFDISQSHLTFSSPLHLLSFSGRFLSRQDSNYSEWMMSEIGYLCGVLLWKWWIIKNYISSNASVTTLPHSNWVGKFAFYFCSIFIYIHLQLPGQSCSWVSSCLWTIWWAEFWYFPTIVPLPKRKPSFPPSCDPEEPSAKKSSYWTSYPFYIKTCCLCKREWNWTCS